MARKKGSRRRKKVTPVGVMTTLAGANVAHAQLLGGQAGIDYLKNGDFNAYIDQLRNRWQTTFDPGTVMRIWAPLFGAIVGSKLLGRSNPGVTIGKVRVKLI